MIEFKAEGKPIVLISSIFQHSPYVFISLKDKNIQKPSNIIGKKVMIAKEQGMIIFKSMLGAKNIIYNKVQFIEHTWNNLDITNGYADAMTGYITVEPFQLEKAGFKINVLKPQNFGVDFYGDMLFTTEDEVHNNPNRVLAIKRATNKGWDYAMTHIDEMCDYILSIPGVVERGITKENLIYEAVHMQELVKSDIVEFGHINKSRIDNMIRYYEKEGIIKKNSNFNNFIFNDQLNQLKYEQYYTYF